MLQKARSQSELRSMYPNPHPVNPVDYYNPFDPGHSPAHHLRWGMFTKAVGVKAGKPDISNSILDTQINSILLFCHL